MTRPLDVESLLAHRAWVRTLSRAIVADPGRADDVEQAAWLTALQHPPRDRRGLRGWFASVVRSRALDAARESRRRAAREELGARRGAEPSAADVAARFDAERRVAAGVQALPEPLRTTVLLRFYEGLSVRATARRMGVPYETARARLHAALARLRESLDDPGERRLGAVLLLASSPGGIVMASSKKSAVAAVLVLALLGGTIWFLAPRDGDRAAETATAPVGATPPGASPQAVPRSGPRPSVRGGRVRAEPSVPEVPASPPALGTNDAHARAGSSGATTPADGADPAASAPEAGAGAPVPPLSARSEPPIRLKGKVVDAETGEPIDGARVLYAVVVDGELLPMWAGDTTGRDGVFRNARPDGWDREGARVELRVSKDGYEKMRVPVTEEAPVVRLRPRTSGPLPGRVAGLARDGAGRPLAGVIVVEGYDEEGNNAAQYVLADAGGSFVLEGVPPGPWRFAIRRGKHVEVSVPEGSETRTELTVPADDRSDEERLHGVAPERVGFGKVEPARDEAGNRPPPREVIVTGLPVAPGAVLRADRVRRLFWRTEVRGGEARFPALTGGRWTLVLVPADGPPRSISIDVVPGDGPQRIDFPAK